MSGFNISVQTICINFEGSLRIWTFVTVRRVGIMEINFREHFSWLNKNTFETILRRDRRNDDIQVIDLVIKEALAKGENNCSQMLRVTTKFNDGTKDAVERFIVKGMLIHGIPTIIEEMNLFEKEIHIYEDVLPTVQQLLQSIGDDSELSAK